MAALKKLLAPFFLILCLLHLVIGETPKRGDHLPPTLEAARQFLEDDSLSAKNLSAASAEASWIYQRNATKENSEISARERLKASTFAKRSSEYARDFDGVVDTFPADVRRQLAFIRDIGVSALDNETMKEFYATRAKMWKNYNGVKLCRPTNASDCLDLEPGEREFIRAHRDGVKAIRPESRGRLIEIPSIDFVHVTRTEAKAKAGKMWPRGWPRLHPCWLHGIMADSRDWDERLWVWKGFRDAVGVPNKPLFARYVDIVNEAARLNGYKDRGHDWRYYYGDDVEEKVYELHDEILPLYKQLHAYVRRRLHQVFGHHVDVNGYLPANVLGDMWGRFWVNLYPMLVPYPDRPNIDVTDDMIKQGINATQIFRMADEFFTSLGLIPVNEGFWESSQFVKPDDGRKVPCHPSAWNFENGEDFRISMCTKVTMADFLIAHHEMGHIQYYMQYKDLPRPFQAGANGAFHEAIGEVMALSVATPKHLQEIGLLEDFDAEDKESEINFLLRMSLRTIATLPFSLGLSQWRWDLMRGQYHVNDSMDSWWKMKNDLVGVEAPVERTDEDFDPGAMLHFITDYPFIGYYIRTIIQFQFYKALCKEANHTGLLHQCDFYRSREAGQKLGDMLAMGRSRPWPEAMQALTGQREMKADAILEYFQPLMEWLEKTNEENGEVIGWPIKSGSTRAAVPWNPLSYVILLLHVALMIRKMACL